MKKLGWTLILCFLAMPLVAQTRSADLSRLQAILIDAQNDKDTIPPAAWRVIGAEAVTLANRIAAHSSSTAAKSLRTHVREMRAAAMAGDDAGVRTHAAAAEPFANQLVDGK